MSCTVPTCVRRTARCFRLPVLVGIVLAGSLVPRGISTRSVYAATGSAPRASFAIPTSNVASSSPVMDDRHVVYGVATPRVHPPTCVSCGQKMFANFRVQVYIRDYHRFSTSITVSQPRLMLVGPSGAQIALYSLAGGWLVYTTDIQPDQWQLFARNVVTGRAVLLDSPAMEGVHSRFLRASSDARRVVWQSWTRMRGQTTSVIRAYTFATGRRQMLLSGGTGPDYFYGNPQIAGNHLIFVREPGNNQATQILVKNLVTGQVLALTPPGQWNDEPFVSGDLVVWVNGSLAVGHTHGLVVANLVTGRRVALKHSSSQLPQIAAGRYVVFAPDYPTTRPGGAVQVYDAFTGGRRTIVSGADASGFVPNLAVQVGGGAVLVRMDKPCSVPNGVCPAYLTLISLTGR